MGLAYAYTGDYNAKWPFSEKCECMQLKALLDQFGRIQHFGRSYKLQMLRSLWTMKLCVSSRSSDSTLLVKLAIEVAQLR